MRTLNALLPLALALPCAAQTSLFAPASRSPWQQDLGGAAQAPFMHAESRVQSFYAPEEIGDATKTGYSSFTVTSFDWRYDAAGFGRVSAAQTLGSLTVHMGVTNRGTSDIGALYSANLIGPMTMVVNRTNFSYVPDQIATRSPHPFGGPNGQFTFKLSRPLNVAIPKGGLFVVDVRSSGGTGQASIAAALDEASSESDRQLGTFQSVGTGCPAANSGPAARLMAQGPWLPGGVTYFHGDGYASGAPVLTFLSPFLAKTPLVLPGTTPACTWHLDPGTMFVLLVQTADASGVLASRGNSARLYLPRNPALCGLPTQLQNLSVCPPWSGNGAGIQLSNALAGQTGCLSASPSLAAMTVVGTGAGSSTAPFGDDVRFAAPVLRLQ